MLVIILKKKQPMLTVTVDQGYQQSDAYIVTQGPLEGTVGDFWRMMWDYKCACIVMLCQLTEEGQVIHVSERR